MHEVHLAVIHEAQGRLQLTSDLAYCAVYYNAALLHLHFGKCYILLYIHWQVLDLRMSTSQVFRRRNVAVGVHAQGRMASPA